MRCTLDMGMPCFWNSTCMRRRSSRATSSCRVGAVRTCNRTVVEVRSKLCTPRILGPSTSVCDHAGSPRRAAAAVSSACSVFSTGLSGASDTSTNVCDQSRLRLLTVRISPFAMVTSAPQREVFHPPDVVGDLDRVANHVLVFEHDVEPRDHVSNQCLRPEAYCQAGEPSKSYRRRDVDVEFVQRRQQSHRPDDLVPRAIEHSRQRARLLLAQLRRAPWRRCLLDDQIRYCAQQAV